MEETRRRTVSARRAPALAVLLVALLATGCAGQYRGPRTLAALGSVGVLGGSAAWAAGEESTGGGSSGGGRTLVRAGFVSVVVGLGLIAAAGGWMAGSVKCTADPDCSEDETCREIPAPPGGVPYKQCMDR